MLRQRNTRRLAAVDSGFERRFAPGKGKRQDLPLFMVTLARNGFSGAMLDTAHKTGKTPLEINALLREIRLGHLKDQRTAPARYSKSA